jgi:uncharacterized protein
MESTADDDPLLSLRFAAEDGQPEAMFLPGAAYAQGSGVPRDETAAASWFHRASRKGHARAKTSMGFLYSTGRGVRRDPVLAYLLLTQAATMGDPLAGDMLIRLRRQMHPSQLREAERRVQDLSA